MALDAAHDLRRQGALQADLLERGRRACYFTGDGARRDKDGYFWIVGRIDDVLNVAGHRLGTAEVESALVSHEAVAEAAVVGRPDEIKGQGVVAFVTLKQGEAPTDKDSRKNCASTSANAIGPIAKPDDIRFADALPKTRSGKIMRRLLKEIAGGGRRSPATRPRWRISPSWPACRRRTSRKGNSKIEIRNSK